AGIGAEFLLGQGARELLLAPHVVEVQSQRRSSGQPVAEGRIQALPRLLAVVAIAVDLRVARAHVEVEGTVHLSGSEMVLEEPEGTGLAADLEEARVGAGLGDEVDGAAKRVGPEAQGIAALVDVDALGVEQLEGLEVAEAVGVAEGQSVDENVHATQVEVVAEPGAADREL